MILRGPSKLQASKLEVRTTAQYLLDLSCVTAPEQFLTDQDSHNISSQCHATKSDNVHPAILEPNLHACGKPTTRLQEPSSHSPPDTPDDSGRLCECHRRPPAACPCEGRYRRLLPRRRRRRSELALIGGGRCNPLASIRIHLVRLVLQNCRSCPWHTPGP